MAPWKSETPGQARGISPFFILATPSRPKSRDLEMASDGPYEIETLDKSGDRTFFIPVIPSRPKSRDLEMVSNGPYEIETPGQARGCTYCLVPLSVRVSGSRYACPEKGLPLPGRRASRFPLFPAEEPGSRDGKRWPL
jgi:hypothetical protein